MKADQSEGTPRGKRPEERQVERGKSKTGGSMKTKAHGDKQRKVREESGKKAAQAEKEGTKAKMAKDEMSGEAMRGTQFRFKLSAGGEGEM